LTKKNQSEYNLGEYAKAVAKVVEKDITNPNKSKAFDLFTHGTYLRALSQGTSNVQKNLTAAAKAANKVRTSPPKSRPEMKLQDSPGVAVISAAQAYASQQRLAITLHHIVFESSIRSGIFKLKDIKKFLELDIPEQDDTQSNPDKLGLVDLRNKYKLLFEAIIWARLYGFTPETNKIHVNFGSRMSLVGVSERLLKYFLERLVNPNNDYKPFAAQGNGGVSELNTYFRTIVEKSETLQQQLKMDSIMITKPPVPKP